MNKDNRKFACALKYPEGAVAPFIVAKGKGIIAEQIIEVAKEHDVKIEEKMELVDFLEATDVGMAVPEETWEILAHIFSFILNSEKK